MKLQLITQSSPSFVMEAYVDNVARNRHAKSIFSLGHCISECVREDGLTKEEVLLVLDTVKLLVEEQSEL